MSIAIICSQCAFVFFRDLLAVVGDLGYSVVATVADGVLGVGLEFADPVLAERAAFARRLVLAVTVQGSDTTAVVLLPV